MALEETAARRHQRGRDARGARRFDLAVGGVQDIGHAQVGRQTLPLVRRRRGALLGRSGRRRGRADPRARRRGRARRARLLQRDIGERIDQARVDRQLGRVDHARVGGDREIRSYGFDDSLSDDDGPLLDRRRGDRYDAGVDQGVDLRLVGAGARRREPGGDCERDRRRQVRMVRESTHAASSFSRA